MLEVYADRVVATMPVEGNTQPYGLLHGGASCVLAETLGTVGRGRARRARPVGGRHRAQRQPPARGDAGLVTGRRRVLSRGRTLASYEIVITDDQDRRVCTARLTCILRDNLPV